MDITSKTSYLSISNNNSIPYINLSFNNITDVTTGLIDRLDHITSPIALNLSYNLIKDISTISNVLRYNNNIIYLDLSHNNITDIKGLCSALKYNKSLIHLDLRNNKYNSKQLEYLADTLLCNRSVRNLLLNITNTSSAIKYLLDSACYSSLNNLYITIDNSGDDDLAYLNNIITSMMNNRHFKHVSLYLNRYQNCNDKLDIRPLIKSLASIKYLGIGDYIKIDTKMDHNTIYINMYVKQPNIEYLSMIFNNYVKYVDISINQSLIDTNVVKYIADNLLNRIMYFKLGYNLADNEYNYLIKRLADNNSLIKLDISGRYINKSRIDMLYNAVNGNNVLREITVSL